MNVIDRPRTPREWQAVVGIDNQSFTKLAAYFGVTYEKLRGKSLNQTLLENPKGDLFKFKSYSDWLFYLLFILKSGITFDQAAFVFQFDLSNAKRNFDTALNILYKVLSDINVLPIRNFASPEDMKQYFHPINEIIIDGTEQNIERPSNYEEQKKFYSGKKKQHTRKCLILSTNDTYIHYLSSIYSGRQHDFGILKEEFPPQEKWFEDFIVRIDLGYLVPIAIGIDKEYPNSIPFLPSKNYKKRPLNYEQIEENKQLARKRIKVEHSIGEIKRYEIISAKSRLKNEDIYDKTIAACAGLWNFFITR